MRIRKHTQSNPATRGKRRESSASMPSITRAEPSLAGIPTLRVVLSRSAIERGELMAVPELGQEVFPGIPRGFADSANSADGCDVNRNSLALRAEADRVAGLSESGVSTPAKQHSPPAKASRLRPEDDLTAATLAHRIRRIRRLWATFRHHAVGIGEECPKFRTESRPCPYSRHNQRIASGSTAAPWMSLCPPVP